MIARRKLGTTGRSFYMTACFLLLTSVLFYGCKSSKSTTESVSSTSESAESNDDTYLLVVSFFSPGNGIDRDAKNRFSEFLETEYADLSVIKTPWGREGEVDYCIKGDGLSKESGVKLLEHTKKLLSSSQKVRIYENAPCRRKKD